MSSQVWHQRYLDAAHAAEARAVRNEANPTDRHLAFGFTNSVDRVVKLDGTILGSLASDLSATPSANPGPVHSPTEFVSALLSFVESGQGGEIWLGSPGVGHWLAATFQGRSQVGGTGIRGANTVAGLGFSSLLHVTTLHPEQAKLIDASGRIAIPTASGLCLPQEAARPADPVMLHVILEFQSGMTVPLGTETLMAPLANRVIVALDPANLRHPLDPHYVAAVADPAHPIRWALVSGFSQVTSAAMCRERVDETLAAMAHWRQKPEPPRIHLELAAMPDEAVQHDVLTRLAPAVDSVGLNADELGTILATLGIAAGNMPAGIIPPLDALQRRLSVPRLSLHTQHCCLTLTADDPATEQRALLYGSLVAGTFARLADFPAPADLRRTLAGSIIDDTSLHLERGLAKALPGWRDGCARLNDRWLVFAPTLATDHPATTIGLGDSFTAGVLAML